MSKLILLVGLPGSGKTKYGSSLKGIFIEIAQLRKGVTGSFQSFGNFNELVHHLVLRSLHFYLSQNKTVILDGELYLSKARKAYISLAKKLGSEVEIHWIDPPYDALRKKIYEQNKLVDEERKIDFSYLDAISNKFEIPSLDEGIDNILYFSDKKLL